MLLKIDFSLPLTDPVLVFAIVLIIILTSPLVFSRLNIPGIVGLILSGVILGPYGFHVLERDASIVLFGTVGLLYIMFLAGLEMDMNDFKRHKYKSIVFGVLTFAAPFVLGFSAARHILNYSLLASILLASMFSTHTLIAYPIASKLGITKTRSMPVVIGGTLITDAVVLILLAFVTNAAQQNISVLFVIKLLSFLLGLTFTILWSLPRIGRWFFSKLESDGQSQYLFVLAGVFLSGFLAHAIGVEPIIGAFIAGLALNQLIPRTSALMNRINFVGNTIFIPFFLISVGMLVDFKVLFNGWQAILIALLIIVISFTGKWMAAFLTQKIFNFTTIERRFIWGMSSAHAAATIAVVIVGFNLKLLDENVLNGTVILILVSCLGSSVIVEKSGRAISIQEESQSSGIGRSSERILVPLANPANIDRLVDVAIMIKNNKSTEPIFPLVVLQQYENAEERINQYQKKIELLLENSALDIQKELVFRVDVNVGNGILRAIKELQITEIVIGWNGKTTAGKRFGPILDRIIANASLQIMVCKLIRPINTVTRFIVTVPENAEKEEGFPNWVETILQLSRYAGGSLTIFCSKNTASSINEFNIQKENAIDIDFQPYNRWTDLHLLVKSIKQDDVLVPVLARPYTLSYVSTMDKVPSLIEKHFQHQNIIVLYPEQRG